MPSYIVAAAAATVAALQVLPSAACTIVAVGADASASGFPIMSHTDDSGMDTTDIRWIRVPRREWPAGSKRPLYNWADGYPRVVSTALGPEYEPVGDQKLSEPIGYIPQVPETYAYWDMDYGVQNEFGVSIGESTCTCRTYGWPATPDKPYGYNRAGIEDLSKIALERCQTARCAVQTMGDIAVEVGFYSADSGSPDAPAQADSAEGLAVADSKEVWIFNVMTGAQNASAIWAAQRIPTDHVAAVGNTFTIRAMDLNDPENFLYSPGVWKLAEENGWRKDDAPGTFDFYGAYGHTPPVDGTAKAQLARDTLSVYSSRRMWRIFSLLSPDEGAKLDPEKGNLPTTVDPYPGSVPAPRGSVSARMVMDVLRDHYEGTPFDLTAGMAAGPFGTPNRGAKAPEGSLGIWERAISMHRTSWAYVLEPRPDGRSISWLGYDSPHGTAFLPFFGAAGSAPESFHSHKGYMAKFSTEVAWWPFNFLNQYSDLNFKLINADVRAHARKVEDEGEQKVKECNAQADWAKNSGEEGAVVRELTLCSNEFAQEKVAEWWQLCWALVAKYRGYTITDNESSTGAVPQQYPAWWVHSTEVGFTSWTPWGPFHGILDSTVWPTALSVGVEKMPLRAYLGVIFFTGFLCYQLGLRRGRGTARSADQSCYVAAP